jgi:hypothetical protein
VMSATRSAIGDSFVLGVEAYYLIGF